MFSNNNIINTMNYLHGTNNQKLILQGFIIKVILVIKKNSLV